EREPAVKFHALVVRRRATTDAAPELSGCDLCRGRLGRNRGRLRHRNEEYRGLEFRELVSVWRERRNDMRIAVGEAQLKSASCIVSGERSRSGERYSRVVGFPLVRPHVAA